MGRIGDYCIDDNHTEAMANELPLLSKVKDYKCKMEWDFITYC